MKTMNIKFYYLDNWQLNETFERLKKENEKFISENREAHRVNKDRKKSSRGSCRNSSNVGMNYIPKKRIGNSNYLNEDNITSNSNYN